MSKVPRFYDMESRGMARMDVSSLNQRVLQTLQGKHKHMLAPFSRCYVRLLHVCHHIQHKALDICTYLNGRLLQLHQDVMAKAEHRVARDVCVVSGLV